MENSRILYLGCKKSGPDNETRTSYFSRLYLNGKFLVGLKGPGSYDGASVSDEVTNTPCARLARRLVNILDIEEEKVEIRGDACFEPLSENLGKEEAVRLKNYILGR